MRALLIANPKASASGGRTRNVLVSALGSDLRVDAVQTKARGHAVELGAQAAESGYELVVALGGDGTVNEVVNGLMSHGPSPEVPALAVVPAGSTNVFARALGMPNDPVEATADLLEAISEGRSRRVALGRANDRWFTFSAGVGIDGAVVEKVERKRAKGRKGTVGLYFRSAVARYYLGQSRRPLLRFETDGEEPLALGAALVCNTDPWTYFGKLPIRPCPQASFDSGLDVMGMTKLRTFSSVAQVIRFFTGSADSGGRNTVSFHDLSSFRITAEQPLPFQADGEALGDVTQVDFQAFPNVLRVVV